MFRYVEFNESNTAFYKVSATKGDISSGYSHKSSAARPSSPQSTTTVTINHTTPPPSGGWHCTAEDTGNVRLSPPIMMTDHRGPLTSPPGDHSRRNSYGDTVCLSRPPRSPSSFSQPPATHKNDHRSTECQKSAPKVPRATECAAARRHERPEVRSSLSLRGLPRCPSTVVNNV
ncbi:hypothetical protein ACHAW5_000032 [Stephanodiscus triporus]|uniref:Uncharacterized protein n=1 Tax=Stephanodiscus triporus TaxID=2934178 RepID=A0ABD3PTB9_9STRA